MIREAREKGVIKVRQEKESEKGRGRKEEALRVRREQEKGTERREAKEK